MRADRQLETTCDAPAPAEQRAEGRCPVCRGDQAEFVMVDGNSSLRRCLHCSFLFVLPRPTPDDLKTLYCDEYFTGNDMAAATLQYRAPVFQQCLETLRHLIPQRGRLLDVGCWTGDFVLAASRSGWSACGIELSGRAAEFAAGARGLDVRCCTLSAAPFSAGSFDVVTMLDVLEHVLDPVAELECARALLKYAGVIVIRVPNTVFHLAKTRLCRALKVADIGLQMRYHLNHFTPRTLRAALQRAGFDMLAFQVGAPELIAHAPWARPWAKRTYVRLAAGLHRITGLHVENITVAYARRKG